MSNEKTLINEKREEIEKRILMLIKKKKAISFVEVEDIFISENFNYIGNESICYGSDYPNMIIWYGWTMEAVNIIKDLFDNKIIALKPCNTIIYLIDGKMPPISTC